MIYYKLEDLCTIITDGTHQTPAYSDTGYIFLSSKNVTQGKIDWSNVKYIGEDLHQQLSKRLKPQKNDILLAKNGTTGIAALVDKNEVFDIYVSLALLRPKEIVYPHYFLHVINSPIAKRQFNEGLKGIGVPNLHLSVIKNVQVPVPSLKIQKKIVQTLDTAQSLIDKRKEQIEACDELIKSQFVEMFGDIIHDNVFESNKLKEFSNIGSSKRIYASEYVSDGIPFYRSKEIRELGTGQKPTVELFISEEKYYEIREKYGIPQKGDILIAAIGATIGFMWTVDTDNPFYYKDGNLILISKLQGMNAIYLNYALGILIDDFKKTNVSGSAQLALTIEKLQEMKVVCPPIQLQNNFATFVQQVDKLKFVLQQSLSKLEDNFNALMQKAFKGELFPED